MALYIKRFEITSVSQNIISVPNYLIHFRRLRDLDIFIAIFHETEIYAINIIILTVI